MSDTQIKNEGSSLPKLEGPRRSCIIPHEQYQNHIIILVKNSITMYQCKFCQHTFKDKSRIKCHVACQTGIKPFICEVCGKGFLSKYNLNYHTRIHKGGTRRPFKCHICYKGFTTKSILKDHINYHLGLKPYICKVCDASFSSRPNLSHHRKTHSNFNPITILTEKCHDERRYESYVSGESFAHKDRLDNNLEMHERQCKIEKYLCDEANSTPQGKTQGSEVSQSQPLCETSVPPSPVMASQNPIAEFGNCYDIVWIDSTNYTTINELDWKLLGNMKKHPEELVIAEEENMFSNTALESGESNHASVQFSSADANAPTPVCTSFQQLFHKIPGEVSNL